MIFNHYSNAANSLHFKLFTLESQTRWKIGLQENCYFSFLKAALDDAAFETWKLMNEIHSFQNCFSKGRPFLILSHFEIMNACWTWWHELYKLFFICPCHFLSTWIMKEERGGNGCHLKWHFNTKTKLPNLFTWFDFPLFLFLTKRKSLSREIRILGFLECKQTFTDFFTDFFTISNFLAKSVFFIFW